MNIIKTAHASLVLTALPSNKAQASLRKCTDSPEPSLLANKSMDVDNGLNQTFRHLAPLHMSK